MEDLRDSVIVAHPGTQHSQYLAVGLQKAGLLRLYYTRVFWDPRRWPFNVLRLLGVGRSSRLRSVARRRHPELDPRLVRTPFAIDELLSIVFRARMPRRMSESWMYASQHRFASFVARKAKGSCAYVGYDTSAVDAFESLSIRSPSTVKILDLSHPHVQGYRILKEEAQKRPDISDTIDAPLSSREIDKCKREELLADGIICASAFSRQCLLEDGVAQDRIRVVPYGVDLVRYCPRKQSGPKKGAAALRLLFLGSVGQRKGVFYLLDAMHALARDDIRLTIAGSIVGDAKHFESLDRNVRVLGRVAEAELADLYAENDIFVFPSLVEGFGLVLLEALASGLPIIASTHTAGPDLLRDGEAGWIVPPGDSDALARCIGQCADHREDVEAKRAVARAVAEMHPWDRYYEEIAAAVCSIVDQTHGKQ